MYSWEGQDLADACKTVWERDPRRYRLGLLTHGPRPDGEAYSLSWFGHHAELAQFLMRVEPRRWGVVTGDLIAFKATIQDTITAIEVNGLTESLRSRFNALCEPAFNVLWWGGLEDLKTGSGPWPHELRRRFQGAPTGYSASHPEPLENPRVPDFIRFLHETYPLLIPED